jgi:Sulfotransferase family
MNPHVFVVGCPRSGTTLLRRMLNAHSELAMTRETHWIPKLAREAQRWSDGRVVPDVLGRFLRHPKFDRLGLPVEEVERAAEESPPYADFVAALFDRYAVFARKRLAGDKTPGYVRAIPLLNELFPRARFVHLVRDGRDVCLSALAWERKAAHFRRKFPTWVDQPVATSAHWWRRHVGSGHRAGQMLPSGLYYEVRYENLVADPERESRALCTFLEIEYCESIVRFHEGRTKTVPGLSAKKAWLPPTAGLRDWQTQMAESDVAEFEEAAGDLLEELGYERGLPRPIPRAAATRSQAFTVGAASEGS